MDKDRLLTMASVMTILLFSLHIADDVVRGFEPGGLTNLGGMAIMFVWLSATLVLERRRWTYVILFFGSLLAAGIPALHLSGRGVGGALAASSGGYFFIWTLFALGVVGAFSLMLTIDGLWRSRRAKPAA